MSTSNLATKYDVIAPEPRLPRRRKWLILGVIIAIVLAGAGGLIAVSIDTDKNHSAPRLYKGPTKKISQGDLEEDTTMSGTLRFADSRNVEAEDSGIITWLPSTGEVIKRGQRLYAVDDSPVFLLHGEFPAWRELKWGIEGPDVRQLQENLTALGFPAVPDGEFLGATQTAVKNWQEANDLKRTGSIPLGSVLFFETKLRVGNTTTSIGSRIAPGAELFEATSALRIVKSNLKLKDQKLATADKRVTVHLPGGNETLGKIDSIGAPTETDGSDGKKETVIPIVVTLDEPQVAEPFQQISVTVDIPSERRENVLSVPVGALIALSPKKFGVEVVDSSGRTKQVPVATGLFAGGKVEISGKGITAGQRVVVPQR